MPTFAFPNDGALAERLGTGLQNLLQRFDSARHLQKMPLNLFQGHLLFLKKFLHYWRLMEPEEGGLNVKSGST